MIDCIQKSLNELNPREAQVLRLRYGIGTNQDHTLEEVGRTLGLTRERVRQIESAAIRKLRTPDLRNVCVTISRAEITSSNTMLFLLNIR